MKRDKIKDYIPAEIADRGGDMSKEWYVYFYYLHPETNKYQRFRSKGQINRYKKKSERVEAARKAREVINEDLRSGYNPFDRAGIDKGGYTTLSNAIKYFLETHASRKEYKTRFSYQSTLNSFLLRYFLEVMKTDPEIGKIKKSQINDLLNYYQKQRGYGNRNWNNHLSNMKVLFNFLKREGYLKENPCDGIQDLPQYPTDRNRPPTQTEFTTIMNHLYRHHKPLFLFASIIYYEGIRVTETGRLMREHLEFGAERPFLRIPEKHVKDNEIRIQFISPHLLKYMYEMGIDKLEPGTYLFSSNLKPGKTFIKKIKDLVGVAYRKEIKIGLGIEVDLYSMKHKQATDLVESTSENDIQTFLGHSDIKTTRSYIKRHRPAVKYSFFENQKPLPIHEENS